MYDWYDKNHVWLSYVREEIDNKKGRHRLMSPSKYKQDINLAYAAAINRMTKEEYLLWIDRTVGTCRSLEQHIKAIKEKQWPE